MHILRVDQAEHGMKLISFLAKRLENSTSAPFTQADLHRWIRTGQVRVNKGRAKAFDRLQAGDDVRVPPFAASAAKGAGEDIPVVTGQIIGQGVSVLLAHPDFLAVEKPPYLPSQPGTGHDVSLVSVLREYFAKAAYVPAPAHRLDAATGGIVLAGRAHEAQGVLHALFAAHGERMEKTYLAWVKGEWPSHGETILEDLVAKEVVALPSGASFERMVTSGTGTDKNADAGKMARCRVMPLVCRNNATLVRIVLETGRTHQIRIQLASRSHPVIGDAKYGGPVYPRLLLHAAKLVFPWKGDTVTLLSRPQWDTPFAVSDSETVF
ncbi:MAG: Ribosomal large subunit pseudouridine synthase C [Desulfovibrio sp.]